MSRIEFALTDHAVRQYISRYAEHLTFVQAFTLLKPACEQAKKLKKRTRQGDEIWSHTIEGRRVLFCVRRGRGSTTCTTILPEGADDGYVPEQRVSLPSVADPEGAAFRELYDYVARDAGRGLELAARIIERVEQRVPWRFVGAEGENENARGRDSDGGGVIALLNGTTPEGR